MAWKHVFAPAKGMVTNAPPSGIAPEASPYIMGMYCKDGEITSDFGHTPFPTPGPIKTNALNGSVMKIDQFYLMNGLGYLIALTTRNAYQYNTTTETWDDITWGTALTACELIFTASANVVSTLSGNLTGVIASAADYNGTVPGTTLLTDVAHSLVTGDSIIIAGTTSYNGTFTVTRVDADTFYIVKAFVADEAGTWTYNTTYYKLKGTYASRNVIASAFATGLVSYINFAAVDISDTTQHTHIMFWICSSVTVAADVFRIRLSEQNAGATGATYADYAVPALTAGVWKHCCVDIITPAASSAGTFPNDLNAVLSVGIVANSDPGACTVYLDDVKAGRCFTGDEDNRWSATTMNDTFICTNGVDAPMQYSGTGVMTKLTTTLAAGSITTSELVFTFKDHLCLMNNTENAADCPQRVSWTNIGTINDFVGGTAGYQDLVDDVSWIVGAAILSENDATIYKERAIVSMQWVGGHTPLRFKTQVIGTGALSKDSIDSGTGEHLVVGPDVTFAYKGGSNIEILDDRIKKTMYGKMAREYINRTFTLFIEEDDELQVWIPTSASVPDEVWCTNVIDETWYRKSRTMTCAGYYQEASSLTIGDLVGTIGEQNWRFGDALVKSYSPITLCGDNNGAMYKLDKTTLNNNGAAITNEFQTPDFVLPDSSDYMNNFMRVNQLIYEVAGQSVTTEYSTDGGESWQPTQSAGGNVVALTSGYGQYQQDFDVTTRKIRFRFRNTTASSGFSLRYYGFYWIPRSGRR